MKWFQRKPTPANDQARLHDCFERALHHLTEEGDGDILPIPFEFGLMKPGSTSVLEQPVENWAEYKWTQPRSFIVVRYPLRARRITQFTPLDSMVLEALIFANGRRIEETRRPLHEKTVFSNRYAGEGGPSLYTESLWNGFAQRGMLLASEHAFALKLDIEDFYESIPHAYLEKCLTAAGVVLDHVACVMNALTISANGASQGLPVGPHFSHLLAELCLSELDNILTNEGVAFTRFNDDIHIFAATMPEIEHLESIVRNYLRDSVGLNVNSAKTRLTDGDGYHENVRARGGPKSAEERRLCEDVGMNHVLYHSRPTIQDLAEGRRRFKTLDAAKVIEPYLSSGSAEGSLAYILKLLRSRGVPTGIGFLVDRLDQLYPVITEALCYMEAVAQSQAQVTKKQLRGLFALYERPVVNGSPFLQVLSLRIIGKVADLPNLNKFVENIGYVTAAGRRELLAVAFERQTLVEWVKAQRNVENLTEWERSALTSLRKC
jgi:hypothetical protein